MEAEGTSEAMGEKVAAPAPSEAPANLEAPSDEELAKLDKDESASPPESAPPADPAGPKIMLAPGIFATVKDCLEARDKQHYRCKGKGWYWKGKGRALCDCGVERLRAKVNRALKPEDARDGVAQIVSAEERALNSARKSLARLRAELGEHEERIRTKEAGLLAAMVDLETKAQDAQKRADASDEERGRLQRDLAEMQVLVVEYGKKMAAETTRHTDALREVDALTKQARELQETFERKNSGTLSAIAKLKRQVATKLAYHPELVNESAGGRDTPAPTPALDAKRSRGALIVFEGIDGAGKTTQARRLVDELIKRGVSAVYEKEPTEGPWGQKIRRSAEGERMPLDEELHAFIEDRRAHVEEVIKPALASGTVVVLDRYYFSNAAYQGARGADPAQIIARNEEFAPAPDLLVILELPVEVGLSRARSRGQGVSAFERSEALEKGDEIFRSFERPYITRLDGRLSVDEIAGTVMGLIETTGHLAVGAAKGQG